MAMQPRAWMTSYLFSAWISHFIACICHIGAISPDHRHLLILDGHSSHATLEVIQEARSAGLDILTLPSHTSHALQPLDVAVFKPFKRYFREYRDFWTSRNMHQPAGKETLAEWVSLALRKALSPKNIKNGFASTRIIPLNHSAVDGQFAPSRAFETTADEGGIVAESPLDGIACEEGTGGDHVALEGTPTANEVSSPTISAFEDDSGTQVDQVPKTNEKGNSQDMEAANIETQMAQEPSSQAEHFFCGL